MQVSAPGSAARTIPPRREWSVVWLGLDQVYAYEGGMMNAQINPGWCHIYPPSPAMLEGPGPTIERLALRLAVDAVVLIGPDLAARWQLGEPPRADQGDPRRHWFTDDIAHCSRFHGRMSYTVSTDAGGKFRNYGGPARPWITLTQGSGLAERNIRLGMVSWMDKDEAKEVGVYVDDPEWTVQTGGAVRALLGAPLCQSPGMTGVLSLRAEPRFKATKSGRKVERVRWWPDNWDQIPCAGVGIALGFDHKREATPAEQRSHVMGLDMRRASLRGASGLEVARTKLYPQGPLVDFAGRPGYYRIDTRPLTAFRPNWDGMPDPWAPCPTGYAPHERWMTHAGLGLVYELAQLGVIAWEALPGIIEEAWTSHQVERIGVWASDLSKMIDQCAAGETTAHLAEILGSVKDYVWTQAGTLVGITQRPDIRDAVHDSTNRKAWLDMFHLKNATPHLPLRWNRDTVWLPVEPGQLSPLPAEGPSGGPLGGWRVLGDGTVPYEVYAASRSGAWWREEARRERRQAREETRLARYEPKPGPRRVHQVPFSETALQGKA